MIYTSTINGTSRALSSVSTNSASTKRSQPPKEQSYTKTPQERTYRGIQEGINRKRHYQFEKNRRSFIIWSLYCSLIIFILKQYYYLFSIVEVSFIISSLKTFILLESTNLCVVHLVSRCSRLYITLTGMWPIGNEVKWEETLGRSSLTQWREEEFVIGSRLPWQQTSSNL